LNTRQFLT